jgi:hypothetical protein
MPFPVMAFGPSQVPDSQPARASLRHGTLNPPSSSVDPGLERKWRPVSQRTELASGEILTGTILSVWLVQPSDKPEPVVVMWPQRPTAVSPAGTPSSRRVRAGWLPMPVQSWRRSKQAGGDDHQHIASDSAQAEVRHHQDQEPDHPKASGSLGVQVSAKGFYATNARGSDDNAPHFTSQRRRDPGRVLRRQLRLLVLEAGSEMGHTWRDRWDSLKLFTPAQYDSLPGMPFPAPADTYPTKDPVADYLHSYV